MPELGTLVHEQALSTRQLLRGIELRQSPSAHYRSLLDFLCRLCEKINTDVLLALELSKTATGATAEAINRLLALSSYALREIHHYCEFFDHAEELAVPSSMTQVMHRLGKGMTRSRPFILRGSLDFNYTYSPISDQLKRLADGLSDSGELIDQGFSVFSFPLANSKDMLANCALAHEYGHLVVDSETLVKKLPAEVEAQVSEIIRKHASIGTQLDFELTDRINKARRVLASWIHETLADAIGLYLLGPAYLFSFVSWFQSMPSYAMDDDEHPCTSYRLQVMLNAAGQLGWDAFMKSELPSVWSRSEAISRLPPQRTDYRYRAAGKCLDFLKKSILQVAKNICGNALYGLPILISSKDYMIKLLQQGIPPAQKLVVATGNASNFDAVSILNAGWLFYEMGFPGWNDRFGKLDPAEHKELLNRLLTKAIDISFVSDAEVTLPREE